MTIIQKCSPHHWTTPKPGDTDLICPDCGRALSLAEIYGSPYVYYVYKAIFESLARLENLDQRLLDAFKGFLGKGPRAAEFHPEGIERSRSLAKERERISAPNKAEKYRSLKELYHKPGFYDGWKRDDNATLPPIVWRPDGEVLPLGPALKIRSLSPFFDWGYDGDSPSQLALAILYDHTGDERRSLEHYQDFKDYREGPARWNNTGWGITPAELESWLIDREMRWK